MKYKIVKISTLASKEPEASILIVYTGGTLGMVYNDSGALVPFNFGKLKEYIPSLNKFDLKITVISFPDPLDSSDINPGHWADIGYIIYKNYSQYEGFVILHGTDTMAYSASAMSFMLDGLNKPIIFTGAQLPLGVMRSDARENLYTAIEIAATKENGAPVVSEVCIYFNSLLLRGNRSKKIRSSQFGAFESENYPHLAQAGISIDYNKPVLKQYAPQSQLEFRGGFDDGVIVLNLFPGINQDVIDRLLEIENLKGLVLGTFGSGNTLTQPWFGRSLEKVIQKGMVILNVSQCIGGKVIQGRYATSSHLKEIGVLSGSDLTMEAAITKMMFLLGNRNSLVDVKKDLVIPICGEMTPESPN